MHSLIIPRVLARTRSLAGWLADRAALGFDPERTGPGPNAWARVITRERARDMEQAPRERARSLHGNDGFLRKTLPSDGLFHQGRPGPRAGVRGRGFRLVIRDWVFRADVHFDL